MLFEFLKIWNKTCLRVQMIWSKTVKVSKESSHSLFWDSKFIQKKLSKKSYSQISHIKNIIQKFYQNFFIQNIRDLFYITLYEGFFLGIFQDLISKVIFEKKFKLMFKLNMVSTAWLVWMYNTFSSHLCASIWQKNLWNF